MEKFENKVNHSVVSSKILNSKNNTMFVNEDFSDRPLLETTLEDYIENIKRMTMEEFYDLYPTDLSLSSSILAHSAWNLTHGPIGWLMKVRPLDFLSMAKEGL